MSVARANTTLASASGAHSRAPRAPPAGGRRDAGNDRHYGEERPAVTGHAEEAWAKNRRVEIVYVN